MRSGEIYSSRVLDITRSLTKRRIEGVLLMPGPNMRYFLGFHTKSWERLTLAVLPTRSLVVPTLDYEKAKSLSAARQVFHYSDEAGPKEALEEALGELTTTIGSHGVEREFPLWISELLRDVAPGLTLTNVSDSILGMRVVKDADELNLIRRASAAVEKGIVAAKDFVRPDVTETETMFEVERNIIRAGAEETAFCVVQSGANSAMPHAEATSKTIEQGDAVVVDAGAAVEGYHADITRTFFLGEPTDRQRKIYRLVLTAQTRAVECIQEGIPAQEVDRAARRVIDEGGFGEYFIHRTGHGLGLEVHEPPYIRNGNSEHLRPGMVFTVEPGIYLPGKFGVRIEDNIAVKEAGYANLTRLPKNLRWSTLRA